MKNSFCIEGPKSVTIVPYWIPWLGHTLSFANGGQTFLAQCSKSTKEGIFAIILRGKNYTVITAPGIIQQLQNSHSVKPSTEAMMYRLCHFFGASSIGPGLQDTLAFQKNDKLLHMGSPSLSLAWEYINKLTRTLEQVVANLISFNESWIDQSSWERASRTIIQSDFDSVAEVSFFPLIESFVGEVATMVLMGKNFMENNPDIMEDLRTWDSKGTSFMNQVPWFLPQMSAAAVARQRVLRSLRRFKEVRSEYTAGKDLGSEWTDLSDVSPFIAARLGRPKRGKQSLSEKDPEISVDAVSLWAFNKPNLLIAWLLYRVYSDISLLKRIREDIDQFVQVEQPKSELPIPEPLRVTVDAEALVSRSTLLRAVLNETLRLHTNTITYGVMTENLVVAEPQGASKSMADSYILRKDDFICLPHRAQNIGLAIMDGPGNFNPDGFSSIANLKRAGAVNATSLNVFGIGGLACPGRGLAEQEIMITCAVILSMWDIDPTGGAWIWPGQKPGLCCMLPVKDVRVNISRRKQVGRKEG